MQVELFNLKMVCDSVVCHLWSPWRCSALEIRLFDAVKRLPGAVPSALPDELKLRITSADVWAQAHDAMLTILKGWQEEASEAGGERRAWRWLLEADCDADGYDMNGDPTCFWVYMRALVERGGPDDGEKAEEIDFNGFGLSFRNKEADDDE